MKNVTKISLALPCNFVKEGFGNESISFDLLPFAKTILNENLWKREFGFGYLPALEKFNVNNLLKAEMVIHPRFMSGIVNTNRISEIVKHEIGDLPDYLIPERNRNWPYQMGMAFLKLSINSEFSEIPSEADMKVFPPKWDQKFLSKYHIYTALIKELKFHFLAGIHLGFPSSSTMMETDNLFDKAILKFNYKDKIYAKTTQDETFLHDVLIEESNLETIKSIHKLLAENWHLNLWPLKRYLSALSKGITTMDNLLDLLYSLEGLFSQNTTTNHIKTMCVLNLGKTKKEGQNIINILNASYKLRNEIVHGAKSISDTDKVKIGGKTVLAETVFWETKVIVSQMIIKSLLKIKTQNKNQSIIFNEDDMLNLIYSNKTIANK